MPPLRLIWPALALLMVVTSCSEGGETSINCSSIDAPEGSCLLDHQGGGLEYSALAFAPQDQLVALGFFTERIDLTTGKRGKDCDECNQRTPGLHRMSVVDGAVIATSSGASIFFGELPDAVEVFEGNDVVNDIAYDGSIELVVVARESGVFWHSLDGVEQSSFPLDDAPRRIALLPGSSDLVLGLESGGLAWSAPGRAVLPRVHVDPISALAISPDGSLIASATTTGELVVTDSRTSTEVWRSTPFTTEVTGLAHLADDRLAAVTNGGVLVILDATGNEVTRVDFGAPLWSVSSDIASGRLAIGTGFTVRSLSQRTPTPVLAGMDDIREGTVLVFDTARLLAG